MLECDHCAKTLKICRRVVWLTAGIQSMFACIIFLFNMNIMFLLAGVSKQATDSQSHCSLVWNWTFKIIKSGWYPSLISMVY